MPSLPRLRHRISDALLCRLLTPGGGFTWSPRTGAVVTEGFAVSPFKDREEVHLFNKVDRRETAAFVKLNSDLLFTAPGYHLRFVGAWHCPDDGLVYLDVSVVLPTAKQANATARKSKQIAYYDFAAGASVLVKA